MSNIFDGKTIKGKSEEELSEQMINLVGGVDTSIFEALKTAVQLSHQIFHTIKKN